jgi:hypothetical protein
MSVNNMNVEKQQEQEQNKEQQWNPDCTMLSIIGK